MASTVRSMASTSGLRLGVRRLLPLAQAPFPLTPGARLRPPLVPQRMSSSAASLAPELSTLDALSSQRVAPGITELDELNPLRKMTVKRRAYAAKEVKLFSQTAAIVRHSFTLGQIRDFLESLPLDTRKTINASQRYLKARTASKAVYVHALLVHRFGFEEPVRDEERKASVPAKVKDVKLTVPRHVMQLLLSAYASDFSEVLRRHAVVVNESEGAAKRSDLLTLRFVGPKTGLDAVTTWVKDKGRITITHVTPLADLTGQTAADKLQSILPDGHQLLHIARVSRTIISISGQTAKIGVSIHAQHESNIRMARTMLTRVCLERRRSLDRRILALTAQPVSALGSSLPMYAMQTSAPLMPSAGEVTTTDDIEGPVRLTRQDRYGADLAEAIDYERAILYDSRGGEPVPVLSNAAAGEGLRVCEDMLDGLRKRREAEAVDAAGDDQAFIISLVADFGHMLFARNGPPQDTFEVEDQPANESVAPPTGQWPVARAIGWLREDLAKARQTQRLPGHVPSFVRELPPAANKIEAYTASYGVTQSEDEGGRTGGQRAFGEIVDLYRSMAAPSPVSKLFGMLGSRAKFEEHLVLRYVGDTDVLQIKLQAGEQGVATSAAIDGKEEEVSADALLHTWRPTSVEEVRSMQTDILVPDAPVDVRLTAEERSSTAVQAEESATDVLAGEEWTTYLARLGAHADLSALLTATDNTIDAPMSVSVGGRAYVQSKQEVVSRWTWDVVEDPHRSPLGAQLHFTMRRELGAGRRMMSSLQMQWQVPGQREGEQTEEQRTMLQLIVRQLAIAFGLPYSSGRGYSV